MAEISNILLENEMDLPLTHKRAASITKLLKLTLSTQATFATSVSELCRAVIEKSLVNVLSFGLTEIDGRWYLSATVTTEGTFNQDSEELKYARRLVPIMQVEKNGDKTVITLKLGLPKSLRISADAVARLKESILASIPLSPYAEIKRRNIELINLAEEREEQLRLLNYINEQKSEFLSIASHELKTPLTIIKSYAQIGKRLKDTDPEKMAEFMDKIDHQATKVNRLIEQMLELTRIENNQLDYQLEEVELACFVSDVINSLRSLYPQHQILTAFSVKPKVMIDKLRIEQVLINLLSNAVKYSNERTVITVSIDVIAGNSIKVSIKDHGIGLSKANLGKIFEKFFRAEEAAQKVSGLGMGLYITSKIVKNHKGELWAESEEQVGSTFSFSLPMITPAPL